MRAVFVIIDWFWLDEDGYRVAIPADKAVAGVFSSLEKAEKIISKQRDPKRYSIQKHYMNRFDSEM